MKECFKCGQIKEFFDFYKHAKMGDGYLGKCKECTKKDVKERSNILIKDPAWHEKEKERQRKKYYRLGYKEKHKPSPAKKKESMARYKNRYPEKYKAKNISNHIAPKVKGNHLHHWSYNIKDAKDVIEITVEDHAKLHRYLKYNHTLFVYSDLMGNILDTREKHEAYMNKVLNL